MSSTDKAKTILILGCGGFIGSHILERVLATTDYHVYGIDIASAKIKHLLGHEGFEFVNLNVHNTAAVRAYVERSGTVISLVALCNPALYNTIPLDVIDINFSRPLELVKACCEADSWLIHFSTCEVYGKTVSGLVADLPGSDDPRYYLLSEDTSPLVLGPVRAQRWSYACAKQLLERVIYAYGFEKNLRYTIVRPFNFIGPRMDYLPGVDGEGIPRVLACFMDALLFEKPLLLVDGGRTRRSFTYIADAVDAVAAMLARPSAAQKQIFNVGHPGNEISIADLASIMVGLYRELRPGNQDRIFDIHDIPSGQFYGPGYEDSDRRVPDISKARMLLGWEPRTGLEQTLRETMRAYIETYG